MPEDKEPVARIVYASEATIQGPAYAGMECIRDSAMRHNLTAGIHTALLYQSGWFVQWKEGPGDDLRKLMARVEADPRHRNLRIVHSSRGPRLLSGPWSMAIVSAGDTHDEMTQRVLRARRRLQEGRPYAPPAVWRQLSTPMEHPGAAHQAEPDAFQRMLVCAAAGDASFALVRWLASQQGQPVVHRRFAGDHGLDVGTDYVDFENGECVARVIAMARNGLLLPLTRAFLPDYSHVLLLLSGDRERDLLLVGRVADACRNMPLPPVLVGVAADAATHAQSFALARQRGLFYLDALASPLDPAKAWAAASPLLERWRDAANSSGPLSLPDRAAAG